jgi:4'-phosphopantetheinyl transferase
LAIDEIEIWHGHVSADHESYPHDWRLLDENEQAQAGKMKMALQRQRYVEIHARLRQLLAQLLNQAPEKIRLNKTAFGKPYLVDNPELVFNLSHSGNAFLIAVGSTNCQLGVDLEQCKPRADFSALVKKCFAEQEIEYWNRLPEIQKKTEFYRFWTRKEAFVKAIGRGLALGLKQCVINPQKPSEFLSIPADCGLPSKWHVFDIATGQEVCSALVVDKDIRVAQVKNLDHLFALS